MEPIVYVHDLKPMIQDAIACGMQTYPGYQAMQASIILNDDMTVVVTVTPLTGAVDVPIVDD